MTRAINTILFDLGDTLLDFGEVDLPRLFDKGATLAYEYLKGLDGHLPSFHRYRRRHLRAIHWHELLSRLTKREFNSMHVMETLCRRMNFRLSREQLIEVCWCLYEQLSHEGTVEEGAAALLRDLQEKGIKVGLISNTFIPAAVLDRHLQQVGLLDLLPTRVYSCEAGRRKPHPRVFTETLRQIGSQPAETIFVGDSPKADIRGANRLGMVSVLKDPTGKHAKNKIRPAHTIKSILELRDVVAEYRNKTPNSQ